MSNIPVRTMASDARYSAFEHGGLEVAHQQDGGLEVIPDDTTGPEVVPGSKAPLDRRSSLNHPELLHPGQYETGTETETAYSNAGVAAPPYSDNGAPHHVAYGKESAIATPQVLESGGTAAGTPKRYCGLAKRPFIIVLIVAIVVILAAVLGGVLGGVLGSRHSGSASSSGGGSQLNSSTSNLSPLSAQSNTGLASVLDGDGTGRLLTYYQDGDGRIMENSYLNGKWSLSDQSQLNSSVVTTDAQVGTSIAAVSYSLAGKTFRQIFYLSSQGFVQSMNSSSRSNTGVSTDWTAPVTVARDKAASSSIAMAACADNTAGGMTGIRMYYGSQNNTIQEVGFNFSAPQKSWIEWEQFQDSDYNSGVACTLYNTGDDRFISVYFRNSSTGNVDQQVWNYRYQNGWSSGPSTNVAIASGSDVAACNDGQLTDYVFYQLPGGTVTRAMVQPAATSDFLSYANQGTATVGTRLSAAYVEGGSLYVFQNATSPTIMWAKDISRSGNLISEIAIP